MQEQDAMIIYNELLNQNWHPTIETYKNYYRDQELNRRLVFVAEYEGNVAGYTTLLKSALDGPFANKGISEIADLNVFIKYRKNGNGKKLLDVAEKAASEISDTV